jgi:D-3-phosphoglycerate dehydrogenase
MYRALITTVPFGQNDKTPLELLDSAKVEFVINPLGRKIQEHELAEMIPGFDILIAGTEKISKNVLARADRLKLISRVGIGLDGVDLIEARRLGIQVAYTPDAPAPAVAELAVGLFFSLLRSTHLSNAEIHKGSWSRHFGRRISECTVGIIGVGRIGSRVLKHLSGFDIPRILVHDANLDIDLSGFPNVEWVDKETIYRQADLISIHVPLDRQTKNMVTKKELLSMKADALIVNTSRGGIVNEADLHNVLTMGHLGGAAIDVFEMEPYVGPLSLTDRCLCTAHMGSMSLDCRGQMEIEAVKEAVRYVEGSGLEHSVPEAEYTIQEQGLADE